MAILLSLLEAAMRSLGMAGVVWLGLRMTGMSQVPVRRAAWVLVLASAVAMPAVMRLPVPSLGWRLPVFFGVQAPAEAVKKAAVEVAKPMRVVDAAPLETPVLHGQRSLARSRREPGLSSVAVGSEAAPVEAAEERAQPWNWQRARLWLAGLYAVVAGCMVLLLAVRLGLAWQIWKRARPVETQQADAGLRLRASGEVTTPVNFGRGILLPADYREWPEETLRVVVAHEQAHVRQGDFFVTVLASLHTAVFWFSPLAWWLKRTLSALAEELSDAAGVAAAPSAPAYAEILLQFAARPRPTRSLGVAMANPKHLSSRIERILDEKGTTARPSRRMTVLAAGLVVAALTGTVCLVHLAPVQAAMKDAVVAKVAQAAQTSGQMSGQVAGQVTTVAPDAPVAPIAPDAQLAPVAPDAPQAPAAAPSAPAAPEAAEANDQVDLVEVQEKDDRSGAFRIEHDRQAYVFVEGGNDSELTLRGVPKEKIEKLRKAHKGSYLYFEHNGKAYVIDDPALIAEAKRPFKEIPDFKLDQAKLQAEMAELQKEMSKIDMEQIRKQFDSPEFKAEMDKLGKEMGELSAQKAKELAERTAALTAKMDKDMREMNLGKIDIQIGDLDGKIGDIQVQIGDLNGKLGEKLGQIGEKQGELGEKMGKIGEKLGRLGMLDGQKAEEANRKMNGLLDEAVKSGKAKPVE